MPFAQATLEDFGFDSEKLLIKPPVVDVRLFMDKSPNQRGVMNTGACIPKKQMQDFLELAERLPGETFNLYAVGHDTKNLELLNAERGSIVNARPIPYWQSRTEPLWFGLRPVMLRQEFSYPVDGM
jgi:hypothetical protein